MPATLIDCKSLAASIRDDVARRAADLRKIGTPASLVAILIGDDPAALSYSASQAKSAAAVGIDYRLDQLSAGTSQEQALAAIDQLNRDRHTTGIMVHVPAPRPIDSFTLQQRIAPEKDVEGVNAASLGLLALGRDVPVPCTAAAAFHCLKSTGVNISGMEAVVVGRSAIVGKPLAMLLLAANATVTQCHTKTRDLAAHTRRARVLFAAAGSPNLIGAQHVSTGTIVIDVGTNRVPLNDGSGKTRMVGDVDYDSVKEVASHITPVPGGVGPVTVAMLLQNVVAAAERLKAG